MKIKNIPNKIYIQIGEDCDEEDFKKLLDSGEVTWCDTRINRNDLVYYRRRIKKGGVKNAKRKKA